MIVVYGANGTTGRFVVEELRKRGHQPVLAGRTEGERLASIDDPAALDLALRGASVVVNCAGPFSRTAVPVVEAALRAGIHYVDVSAEQPVSAALSAAYADAGVVIAPSLAFYGGLGDLLATVAMGEWQEADEILIGIALDSWHPTEGTRETGRTNAGKHVVYTDSRLQAPPNPPERMTWTFPEPFGTLEVRTLPTADQVTIPMHVRTPHVRVFMNDAPLEEVRDPSTPPPVAYEQVFVTSVVVRKGGEERRLTVRGRDIYASTAPLVAEAVERLLDGRFKATGVVALGQTFDADDFLHALTPAHIEIVGG